MYRRHIQNCELRTEISVICDFFCVFGTNCELRTEISVICDFFCVFGTRLSTWCKAVEMMLSDPIFFLVLHQNR